MQFRFGHAQRRGRTEVEPPPLQRRQTRQGIFKGDVHSFKIQHCLPWQYLLPRGDRRGLIRIRNQCSASRSTSLRSSIVSRSSMDVMRENPVFESCILIYAIAYRSQQKMLKPAFSPNGSRSCFSHSGKSFMASSIVLRSDVQSSAKLLPKRFHIGKRDSQFYENANESGTCFKVSDTKQDS